MPATATLRLVIRTSVPLEVTVHHASNPFASDGDSRYVDAAGAPSDRPSERRRLDADTEIEFAGEGALEIAGDGDIELENRSGAALDVRGRFTRLDAAPERGPALPPGSCWRIRVTPRAPVRVRRPGAADLGLRRLWRRLRGERA